MRLLAAAFLVLASAAQHEPPRPPRDPDAPRPQGQQFGEPNGADLAQLTLAPDACHGDHVLVKGRVDYLEHGTYWLLVDGHARVLLLAAYGVPGTEIDRAVGSRVEVRGICRAIRPKEYIRGVDRDVLEFPDLPPLPAPRQDRPQVSITTLSLVDAGERAGKAPGPETTIIRDVLADPSAFAGVSVRIVGLFRGRNLFDDLPSGSQRSPSHWVLREDDTALWVTGKAPRGKGWTLDPEYRGDTVRWLAVEGKVEVLNGIAYLRASKLTLTRAPSAKAAESR